MKTKQNTIADDQMDVHVANVELQKGEELEHTVAVPEGADTAAILVETTSGSADVNVQGVANENLSRYKRVKAFVSRVSGNTKDLVIKIGTKAGAKVTVTVAFFKQVTKDRAKKLPCRLCKAACGLALSITLAHFGIPYLDAELFADMPDVLIPSELPGGSNLPPPPDLATIGTDPNSTVPVHIGKPVKITDACREAFETSSLPGWLMELYDRIDPGTYLAVRGILKGVEWFYEAKDSVTGGACRVIGLCPPADKTELPATHA